MNNPICIYHGGCADGFTAAWAVWCALGDIEFYPGVYGEAPPDVTGRDVIMVDFSYKRPVIDAMTATCRTMLILDHHKTAEADLAGIAQPYAKNLGWDEHLKSVHNAYHQFDRDPRAPFAIFDMQRSGAQIAWDFFHPGQSRPTLVDYVADRDLWRFEMPWSREVSAYIYSWPMEFKRWDIISIKLAGGELDFQDVFLSGGAILRQHDKNVASLIKTTRREMVIGGHTVPVANVPHFMASDAGNILAKGHPFSATYYDREGSRVFSLRSTADGTDVAAIAAQYGGGGHQHAAGFTMPQGWEGDVTPTSIEALVDENARLDAGWHEADAFALKQGLRAEAAEAALKKAVALMNLAHASMRACGWQLAIAAAVKSDDGVIEAAVTEIEADFADFLATHGGTA